MNPAESSTPARASPWPRRGGFFVLADAENVDPESGLHSLRPRPAGSPATPGAAASARRDAATHADVGSGAWAGGAEGEGGGVARHAPRTARGATRTRSAVCAHTRSLRAAPSESEPKAGEPGGAGERSRARSPRPPSRAAAQAPRARRGAARCRTSRSGWRRCVGRAARLVGGGRVRSLCAQPPSPVDAVLTPRPAYRRPSQPFESAKKARAGRGAKLPLLQTGARPRTRRPLTRAASPAQARARFFRPRDPAAQPGRGLGAPPGELPGAAVFPQSPPLTPCRPAGERYTLLPDARAGAVAVRGLR